MPLDAERLGEDLFRALWDPPEPVGLPKDARDSAERIARAYADYLRGASVLAPSAPAMIAAALADELATRNTGPGGFFGSFVTAWSAAAPSAVIPGAAGLIADGFGDAAGPRLASAMAAVREGGAESEFARGLGAALHSGTASIVWTNPSGATFAVT